MMNPTTGTSKLKMGLAKFSGAIDAATQEPPSATSSGKKSYGATLSALKVLSGADGGGGADKGKKGGGDADLKSAIMQQVYRSSSMNPLEMKAKTKPKMVKTNSLSASGMARAAAASGEIFQPKESSSKESKSSSQAALPKMRRSKTVNEKSASMSDFNGSYHESIARMRKQKMADASERSALSAQSQSSHEPKELSTEKPPSMRDRHIGRAKSFSYSASRAATISESNSPERPSSGSRPRIRRGSSKRLQLAQDSDEGTRSPGTRSPASSKRHLQKSGSSRRLKEKERSYDASPQRPSGTNVIALLRKKEPVTDSQMMQKGNRQMFHSLMFKTRMGIDMDRLRRKVEGKDDSESASDGSHSEEDA